MQQKFFPVIDLTATGKNIMSLRQARGMTVRDLQAYFGFAEPQAIYKWQSGKSLPTVDNLYALSVLLDVPMDDILVPVNRPGQALNIHTHEQQVETCCSTLFTGCIGRDRTPRIRQPILQAARWINFPREILLSSYLLIIILLSNSFEIFTHMETYC